MSVQNYSEIFYHYGHQIVIAHYSSKSNPAGESVAIECEDCSEVLLDYEVSA